MLVVAGGKSPMTALYIVSIYQLQKTKTVVKFTPPLHVTLQIPGISLGGKHLDFSKYLEEDESPWDQIQSLLCLPLHSYHTPVGRG